MFESVLAKGAERKWSANGAQVWPLERMCSISEAEKA